MTTDEPLAYDSLKSVLLYMEPNLRFKLSYQIPSIRYAEKATPLHMESMSLASNQFIINGTVYKMEVIRKYRNCKKPETQQILDLLTIDDHGFVAYQYDPCINSFETRDWCVERTMAPGDVKIEAVYEEERMNEEVHDTTIKLKNEKILAIRLEKIRLNRVNGQDDPNEEQRLRFEILGIEYSTYLKFTVESPSETNVKYFEYNKKIPETMKYLYEMVLGGRKCSIRLYGLFLDRDGGILRLPEDLKLIIKAMILGQNVGAVCDALAPLIHESSFPLQSVYIGGGEEIEEAKNYKHQMIQNAKHMHIIGDSSQDQWLEMLLKIPVEVVYLNCKTFPKEDLKTLIDTWLENGKEIGTLFSLGIDEQSNIEELLESVTERSNAIIEEVIGNGCTTFPNVVTIPMKNNSELCFQCYETTDEEELEDYARWQLYFEVITANHRHLWNVDFDDDFFD